MGCRTLDQRREKMAERATRQLAENALKHLCERIGAVYTTLHNPIEGAWFLDASRSHADIAQWTRGDAGEITCVSHPLGEYGRNLTFSEIYDRCWFADRCFTAHSEALTHAKATPGRKLRG